MAEDEDEKERLDRKLIEFLNEIRVALPGVQVLFAFLLTAPLTQRWDTLSAIQQDMYYVAFLSAALASVLLIAPSAYHRARWKLLDAEKIPDKERMLVTAHRLAIAGTIFLAIAMTAVVYVISDLLFGVGAAALLGAGMAAAIILFWFALPLYRRLRDLTDR